MMKKLGGLKMGMDNEIPKPASPLPWSIEEITDFGDVISRGFRDANGKGVNRGEEFELFEQPTADYILWAANNAIKLAARVEQLEAALRECGELFRQAGNLSICTIQRPDDMTKLLEHGARVARKALE